MRFWAYEPGQWEVQTPASGLASHDTAPLDKGKKRQRERDDDGDDNGGGSGDWQFKGTVLTTDEVDRLGGGRRLRSSRRSWDWDFELTEYVYIDIQSWDSCGCVVEV
jgi:hypothetical protein